MQIDFKLRGLPSGPYTVEVTGTPREVAVEVARSFFVQDRPLGYDSEKRKLRRFSPRDFIAQHFDNEKEKLKSLHTRAYYHSAGGEPFQASVNLSNGQVSPSITWLLLTAEEKRRAWLVLAMLLADLPPEELNLPPRYISQSAARAIEQRKSRKRVGLIALCVVLLSVPTFKFFWGVAWDAARPQREFNLALQKGCDRYLARMSTEPGLFSYLKSRGMCRLVMHVASDRWGENSREGLVKDAVFDSCLLLATDPSDHDEIEDYEVSRYASIPAHVAREYVEQCGEAGRRVYEGVAAFSGSTAR